MADHDVFRGITRGKDGRAKGLDFQVFYLRAQRVINMVSHVLFRIT
jgi:hypothetical protein